MLKSPFKKVAALKTSYLIKKRLQHRCFPVNNVKFLRTPISKNDNSLRHERIKLEKWEMKNIKLHKSDDLVSGIFKSSPSKVLKNILVLNIFFKFQENVSRKVSPPFKRFLSTCEWLLLAIQMMRYCFIIITNPLNPVGCYFEKISSHENISYKEKDLFK